MQQVAGPARRNGFDAWEFEHCALPEIALEEIDLRCVFLGHALRLPLLISSMTGGPQRAASINRHLAEAAQELGIAMAVGSQRIALEACGASGLDRILRTVAPDIPLFSNFGAAQLNLGYGCDEARRAVEAIGADGLILHLNPLQEALQKEGETDWRHLLRKIEQLVQGLGVPLMVKEIGCGISPALARQLASVGVAAIDVAGAGGTSWAAIEAGRMEQADAKQVAACFTHWGIPTSRALREVARACPQLPLIGSGGIRHGLDVAKALRYGATLAGQAGGVLAAAMESTEAVLRHFRILEQQLRIACFCTGSPDVATLRQARIVAAARNA